MPIVPERKAPMQRGWRATPGRDPEWVARQWQQRPDAWVGIATGGGRVVVDVDTRHGGCLDPAWPQTLTARTPSGGWHLHYFTAQPVPCSVGRLATGVDVRGEGGLVVVPPSPGYEWAALRAVAELPAELITTLTRREERSRGYEIPDAIEEGGRNDGLARLAGHLLATGLPADALSDELMEFNALLCCPPLDEREVGRIAASITRAHERAA